MEEKRAPMARVTAGYGLMLAIALIIFSLILFVLDLNKNAYLPFLSYAIMLGGIIWAQMNFRDKYAGGFQTYGKSFSVGFLTAVFASVIMAVYTYIYFNYIDPGAIQEGLLEAEERMIEQGIDDMDIEQYMAMAERFQNATMYTIMALLGNTLIGLIISLITAVFTKREGNPEQGNI